MALLLETREDRKRLNWGTSLSLMDCWSQWLLPHQSPQPVPGRWESGQEGKALLKQQPKEVREGARG